MPLKLVGLGQCGCTIVRDFQYFTTAGITDANVQDFQYLTTAGTTDANVQQNINLAQIVGERANQRMEVIRRKWREIRHGSVLPEPPELLIGDLDENNHHLNSSRGMDGTQAFTGRILPFVTHDSGGCASLHVLGEQVMRHMLGQQHFHNILFSGREQPAPEILSIAFSAAGGIGGGASTALAEAAKMKSGETSRSSFILGISVLPREGDTIHSFSTGRFLVKHFAQNKGFDGTLLVSNEVLPDGIGLITGFKKLHFYITDILIDLSFSVGRYFPPLENPGHNELKSLTNGDFFCVGFAETDFNTLNDMCKMFIKAVRPIQQNNEDNYVFFEGLSLTPSNTEYLNTLNSIYEDGSNFNHLLNLPSEKLDLPIEFRQAIRVGLFLGIPFGQEMPAEVSQFVKLLARKFFPKATLKPFTFYHYRRKFSVSIWIVGLCSSNILTIMDQYIRSSWDLKEAYAKNTLYEIIHNNDINIDDVISDIDREKYTSDLWPSMAEILRDFREPFSVYQEDIEKIKLNRQNIIESLRHYTKILNR